MRNLEDHLDYHAKWQVEVLAYGDWFGRRNRIIEKVRTMRDLEKREAPASEVAAVRAEILERLAPFRPTRGLRLEERGNGRRTLKLTVSTDIGDEGVSRDDSPRRRGDVQRARPRRARAASSSRSLWNPIPAAELYPEGPLGSR